MDVVNLANKFSKFSEHWSPKIIAQVNGFHVKAVKVSGEFVWHAHNDTDELFFVHKGNLVIQLREREVALGPGELFVVPKGVDHRPVAREECEILVLEPAGTLNTGDAGGDLTASDEPWI